MTQENLDSLEKNRRMLMDCYNSMEQDIKSKYDMSNYNNCVLQETLAYVKVSIRHIEEGQDRRNRILGEGKYQPK